MKHLGDFDLSTVIDDLFTTYSTTTGAPATLGGSGVSLVVYKDNGTTQSSAGITLTPDFDSKTGLNHYRIDTSADGTFYSAGSFFNVVIEAGTVGAVSVVGAVVGSFTLRKNSALKPTTAGRTLDVSSGGEAGIDWANIGSPTTAVNLSGTNIDVDQVVASVTAGVTLSASATSAQLVDDIWDEVLTGATHNVTNSAGRRLRQVRSALYTGTAQAGAATSITLDTGASTTDNIYSGEIVSIVSGTGAGQTRSIVNYVGSTRIATVDRAWITNPDNTSVFEIVGTDERNILQDGVVAGASSTSLTLSSGASATNDTYNGLTVFISAGAGAGQARLITDYVGSTKVATTSPAWATTPDTTSVYQIIPVGQVIVESFNGTSLADINAEVVDALSTDTYAEPGQGAPAATASLAAKIGYLYKAWRNKSTQTSSTYSLFADDGTTVDQKATVSDDGTTLTKGETATGP